MVEVVVRRHVDAVVEVIWYEVACLLIDDQVKWLSLLEEEELRHVFALVFSLLHWHLVRLHSPSAIDPHHLRRRRDQISLQIYLLLKELFLNRDCLRIEYVILGHE